MPGHNAIILTAASVAFFPGCVSCNFAKIKCRSLGGMKGTTFLKMIPLYKVSASFCCLNPFSASEHCFQLPLLTRFIMSWKSLFIPSSILISAWVSKQNCFPLYVQVALLRWSQFSCYKYDWMSFLRKNPANGFFRGVSSNCCFFC